MRRTCPKCGASEVKVTEDKSKPVSYFGQKPQYAKKFVCKKCAHAWTSEDGE